MRVSFVTPSTSRLAGGLFEIQRRMAQCLAQMADTTVEVLTLTDARGTRDAEAWMPVRPKWHSVRGPRRWGYAPALARSLDESRADIAHLHALWMYTSWATWRWHRRTGKPYVITINGMLDPWAVRNSAAKKQLALLAYESRTLREAACVQVNSAPELEVIRQFGLTNPVCVIPNGVDPLLALESGAAKEPGHLPQGRLPLLYLGRLHPKKNLENLLRGFAIARRAHGGVCDAWVLVLAGWDQGGYEARLRAIAQAEGLTSHVSFVGPVFGDDKRAALVSARAAILPSYSEGAPMAILEAWAARLPVLMTPACNLSDGFAAGAAIRIGTTPESIAAGIAALCGMSPDARAEMGSRGLAFVERNHSWPTAAAALRDVYRWVTGAGPRPEGVVTS